ncbi:thiol-disulfide isomerase/thioredoxin [Pseudomonas duriflava]|uniref:Thiol-disulfide isomerase/thioredoxin n=1 Tax=Pseudomonas duriflava TaxID=459528 RepID=A0A562QQW0_9PSED|nr:TlpA disulfide reductase family protein [Pseudomonas duriflava]TWI58590.1 thiol-disulfide isomerase/thioredoxin [Pseudomonas duriflava]
MNVRILRHGLLLLLAVLLAACSPDFGLDQHGQKINRSQWEDRWLVINYWAEWCGPCHKEIPELNALAQSEGEIAVWGVNYDHLQGEALRQSAEKMSIRYGVFQSDPATYFSLPVSNVLPATYLIDPHGKVRAHLVGEQTAEAIRQRITALEKDS